jgi:hypothetical protein
MICPATSSTTLATRSQGVLKMVTMDATMHSSRYVQPAGICSEAACWAGSNRAGHMACSEAIPALAAVLLSCSSASEEPWSRMDLPAVASMYCCVTALSHLSSVLSLRYTADAATKEFSSSHGHCARPPTPNLNPTGLSLLQILSRGALRC